MEIQSLMTKGVLPNETKTHLIEHKKFNREYEFQKVVIDNISFNDP